MKTCYYFIWIDITRVGWWQTRACWRSCSYWMTSPTHRHPQALCIFSFALRYYGQPATMAQWICPGPRLSPKNGTPKSSGLYHVVPMKTTNFDPVLRPISLEKSHDPTCSSHHGLNVVGFSRMWSVSVAAAALHGIAWYLGLALLERNSCAWHTGVAWAVMWSQMFFFGERGNVFECIWSIIRMCMCIYI